MARSTLTHIATIDHTKTQSATLVTARYHLVRWAVQIDITKAEGGRTGHKTVWRSHIKRRQKYIARGVAQGPCRFALVHSFLPV